MWRAAAVLSSCDPQAKEGAEDVVAVGAGDGGEDHGVESGGDEGDNSDGVEGEEVGKKVGQRGGKKG